MKTAGILFIVLSCSLTGMRMASNISDRVRRLELLLSMLDEISHRLSYLQPTMLGLMTALAAQKRFSQLELAEPCAKALSAGQPFSECWSAAVTAQREKLGDGTVEILCSLGDVLGATDLESQLAAISCERELLEERLASARDELSKKGTLFRTMGVLCGVGIAVLLI